VNIAALRPETTQQKIWFTALSGMLGAVGMGFVWLRKRGHLRFGVEND
jgi:hypothetical protein